MKLRNLKGQKLQLTNDGELEIFFLGVGSAFAQEHFQTSLIIVKGDTHVLVDFGMDGPRALKQLAGLSMSDVEFILPTHSHADHVGGVEMLALWNRYIAQRLHNKPKLTCIITPEYQRILWDYTLRGGLEWNEEQKDGRRRLSFGDFFNIITPTWKTSQPREIHEVNINGLHLEIFRTNHIPEQAPNWEASFVSYGLFIDNKIFYSADTQFDRALLDMYEPRTEHFFHDVQFFPGAVHAPLEDLKTLPAGIKKRMSLIHYADNYRNFDISGFYGFTTQGVVYSFG